MENPLGTESKRDLQAVGAATGLGCTVVVSLLLCIGGGVLLDNWLGTSPIFVLIGVALGMAASGYALYELAVLNLPDRGRLRLKRARGGPDTPDQE
jgi:F0F1-type ATP synthase assembly protein I